MTLLSLTDRILRSALVLDYELCEGLYWQMVSEGQPVMFLTRVESVGRVHAPRQPHPVLRLVNAHVGTEIVWGPGRVGPHRDWFARLQKPGATFDLIEMTPTGVGTEAARVHVQHVTILPAPDCAPGYVQCFVAVAKVEMLMPYDPPSHDPDSGV